MKTAFLVFVVLLQSAFAIPEKDFEKDWHTQVMPFFTQATSHTYINPQGLKLNYFTLTNGQNTRTLVILPGRTEPAIKYAELIYDLKDSGFNFFILDHQGQGASERILPDSHKGHVRYFSDYVKDFEGWMSEVVIPQSQNQDRFLVTHSMGGAIAALYLTQHQDIFKKAVLSSPMFEIDTKPYKENIGRLLTSTLVLTGFGKKYAPDRGPYIPQNDTFEKNEVTHSQVRFEMAKSLFLAWPDLALGGPTNRWVNQSLKAIKKIDQQASRIPLPILMFQSGKDLIVKPSRQNAFCQKHANCRMLRFDEAYHEILQETDSIRDVAITEIKEFLN